MQIVNTMVDIPDDLNDSTPVFGLTKAQLRSIVDNIVQDDPATSFDVTIEHQVQGYCGYSAEKIIPTFSYITQSGRTGRATVFVKRFHRARAAEAHHYIYLQKHQAPIPRMYGILVGSDQRETLFLEYLDPIGDLNACEQFPNDLDNLRQLLAVTAQFNSIQPSREYADQLPHRDVGKGLTDAVAILESIWRHACNGDLGDVLKQFCSGSRDSLSKLQVLASKLIDPITGMQTGLIHSDVYPENTGWRRETGELLILDLEWIGFGPRFFDAARWLGAPDEVQPHYQQREELSQYFLEQYVRWGGTATSLEKFMGEVSILWMAQKLSMLWFGLNHALDGHADWTEDRAKGRRVFRGWLHKDLKLLIRKVSRNQS